MKHGAQNRLVIVIVTETETQRFPKCPNWGPGCDLTLKGPGQAVAVREDEEPCGVYSYPFGEGQTM